MTTRGRFPTASRVWSKHHAHSWAAGQGELDDPACTQGESGVGGSGETLHDKLWSLSHGAACLVDAPRTLVGRGVRVSW